VEIDVIVPLLQINSETKKEHHAACSILQPHSIFGSCVDVSLLARINLTFLQIGRVQSCGRPVDAG